jgi:hypothetical protein
MNEMWGCGLSCWDTTLLPLSAWRFTGLYSVTLFNSCKYSTPGTSG